MPFYHILHATPLTLPQKDSIAEAITRIHSTRFTTPRQFVNVDFQDVSAVDMYVAGRRRAGNHIRANVRTGPSRTQAEWNALCREISAEWDRIVGPGLPVPKGKPAPEAPTELRSIIMLGGLAAGLEAGFALPLAGQDVEWLKENWEELNRRADGGDEEMQAMVADVKTRGLMEGHANGLQSAARRLEEALGWGDSA